MRVPPPPRFTVVIPTHDRAALLPFAVRSALDQSVTELEVIIVDDGSTDATPTACAALAASDGRIRVLTQENRGLAAARNAGLARARGAWVAFLDDDDLWHRDFLSEMAGLVESRGAQVGACWACAFVSASTELPASALLGEPAREGLASLIAYPATTTITLGELLLRSIAPINAGMFSTALLRDLGGFDAARHAAEDYDLWLRLAARADIPVLARVLALVRRHPDQMSQGLRMMVSEARFVLERFLADRPSARATVAPRALSRRLALLARDEAYAALLEGDRRGASRAALKSLGYWPWQAKSSAYLLLAGSPRLFNTLRRVIRAERRLEPRPG